MIHDAYMGGYVTRAYFQESTFSVKNHLEIKKQERNFFTSLNLMTAVIPPFSRESLDCLSQTVVSKFMLLFVCLIDLLYEWLDGFSYMI